jgi:hypothetical protein
MRTTLLALAGLMGASLTAHATPVIYDFTGSGSFCTYIGSGTDTACGTKAFTGSVTLELLAAGPSGPDSGIDAVSAFDNNGWVQADFLIQWEGGSFNPAPTPGPTESDSAVVVFNDLFGSLDQLSVQEHYLGQIDRTLYWSYASFVRASYDPSWLADLSFDLAKGLAPGDGAINQIRFANFSGTLADDWVTWDYTGFYGSMDLRTLTTRVTDVPEPQTWMLLGLAFVGLGFGLRRVRT